MCHQSKSGELCSVCGTRRSSKASAGGDRKSSFTAQALPTIIDRDYVHQRLESCLATGRWRITLHAFTVLFSKIYCSKAIASVKAIATVFNYCE